MPSRLGEFKRLLNSALEHGYQTYTISQFWKETKHGKINIPGKCLILRHDIDTDLSTAKRMWEIEHSLSIKSTFFFRLSTFNVRLMKLIENNGGEASYHYEELATFCKKHHIKSTQEVKERLHEIRDQFKMNIMRLRELSGLPLQIVASHGDFVNRKLCIPNQIILKDKDFRKDVNINLEAYDESANRLIESRHSDKPFPQFWAPVAPIQAIENHIGVIYVLIHPRQWRASIITNLKDNLKRLYEQLKY